ncbi:MAG TPA: hypothetical protein VGP76_02400 [Planctomycetaceae bacterium]|jgi:hypothetical protein|nr:hypothetical protein [Planctomycetaceae bacterium]
MAKEKAKRNPDIERTKRKIADEFFKRDPDATASDLYELLKSSKQPVPASPSDKTFNVWANNQKRKALGTAGTKSVRRAKPNQVDEVEAGRDIVAHFKSADACLAVLEIIKKLGSVPNAIHAVKKFQAVSKAVGGTAKVKALLEAIK